MEREGCFDSAQGEVRFDREPEIMFSFAERYYAGGDYENAYDCYSMAAERGYAPAEFALAKCYFNGTGVVKDMKKALQICTYAAEHGCAQAQLLLGYCYQYGYGVCRNDKKALGWYKTASDQGNAVAHLFLARYLIKGSEIDRGNAFNLLLSACESGVYYADYLIANFYSDVVKTDGDMDILDHHINEIFRIWDEPVRELCSSLDIRITN